MMNLTVFPEFCELLIQHSQRYPEWEMQDLYKLLFQAALGSEHAASSVDEMRAWLNSEVKDMGDGPDEPLLDPISPDGAIYRVHLRAFVKTDIDLEELISSFKTTAQGFKGSKENLKCYCHDALELARSNKLNFDTDLLRDYFQQMEENGFPPVHHSDRYKEYYRPAYRVVAWGI